MPVSNPPVFNILIGIDRHLMAASVPWVAVKKYGDTYFITGVRHADSSTRAYAYAGAGLRELNDSSVTIPSSEPLSAPDTQNFCRTLAGLINETVGLVQKSLRDSPLLQQVLDKSRATEDTVGSTFFLLLST
ncbi:hypothetical protein BaRGS_00007893 [Batillaria attramentaria]|uniref:Uncharacterized protein n=1 Tax=Batillaria attramentaria TaxID=370345 RepID=A0ABD0LP80_9CAEN